MLEKGYGGAASLITAACPQAHRLWAALVDAKDSLEELHPADQSGHAWSLVATRWLGVAQRLQQLLLPQVRLATLLPPFVLIGGTRATRHSLPHLWLSAARRGRWGAAGPL